MGVVRLDKARLVVVMLTAGCALTTADVTMPYVPSYKLATVF